MGGDGVERFEDQRTARFGQSCPCGLENGTLVIVVWLVVEDDQAVRRGSRQRCRDSVREVVDADCENARPGLGKDRRVLAGRCAGLQGHHHGTEVDPGAFDGGVVDAREFQHTDEAPARTGWRSW